MFDPRGTSHNEENIVSLQLFVFFRSQKLAADNNVSAWEAHDELVWRRNGRGSLREMGLGTGDGDVGRNGGGFPTCTG